jgi:hypothetical protein
MTAMLARISTVNSLAINDFKEPVRMMLPPIVAATRAKTVLILDGSYPIRRRIPLTTVNRQYPIKATTRIVTNLWLIIMEYHGLRYRYLNESSYRGLQSLHCFVFLAVSNRFDDAGFNVVFKNDLTNFG